MSSPAAWVLQRDDAQIAWLALDKPGSSANTLGRAVLEDLSALVAGLEQATPRDSHTCISGEGRRDVELSPRQDGHRDGARSAPR